MCPKLFIIVVLSLIISSTSSKDFLIRRIVCKTGGLWGTQNEEGQIIVKSDRVEPNSKCKIWFVDENAPKPSPKPRITEWDQAKYLQSAGVSSEVVNNVYNPDEYKKWNDYQNYLYPSKNSVLDY